MSKIYQLMQDSENYSIFLQEWDTLDNSFAYQYNSWVNIDLNTYQPLKLKLYSSDTGKKNFQTDISYITGGLFIFSEKAVQVFKDIIEETGQIIPVETESKRKKFYGFYPNKKPYNGSVINFDKSIWRQAEKGKIIQTLILSNKCPKDDYLFTLFDDRMNAFVTDKFKKLVEENDLKGFDFSKTIPVMD